LRPVAVGVGWSMRAVILLVSVVAAVSILWWQAPEMVPIELRHGAMSLEHRALATIFPAKQGVTARPSQANLPITEPGAATQAPLWPDRLERPVHKPLPLVPVIAAAAIAFAGLSLCIWLVRRRAAAARHEMPEWLKAARRLAGATNDKSLRLKQ